MITVLGIDPGYQLGYALVGGGKRRDARIIDLGTAKGKDTATWQAALVDILNRADLAAVAVQVPLVLGEKVPHFGPGRANAISKNASIAGSVKGFCAGYLAALYRQVPARMPRVIGVAPLECKRMGMKLDEKAWRAAWDYPGRCSEHARDATQLAHHVWLQIQLENK